jgi:hypothetical protein
MEKVTYVDFTNKIVLPGPPELEPSRADQVEFNREDLINDAIAALVAVEGLSSDAARGAIVSAEYRHGLIFEAAMRLSKLEPKEQEAAKKGFKEFMAAQGQLNSPTITK